MRTGLGGAGRAQSDGWFEHTQLAPPGFTLDDLGVADYQEDGDLDVFTTNHLSTQLLLANDGTGSFEDRLTAANLNQTPAFPGWEDNPNGRGPERARPVHLPQLGTRPPARRRPRDRERRGAALARRRYSRRPEPRWLCATTRLSNHLARWPTSR